MHHTVVISPGCHSVGNLLVDHLFECNSTDFASYKVPHPLSKDVEITVDAESCEEALGHVKEACASARTLMKQLEAELLEHIEPSAFPATFDPSRGVKVSVRRGHTVSDSSMC